MENRIDRRHYIRAYLRNLAIRSFWKTVGIERYRRKVYNGKKVMDVAAANDHIYKALLGPGPFMVSRFGAVELRSMVYAVEYSLGMRKGFPDYIKKAMTLNAGFFPADDRSLVRFGKLLWESAGNVDLYGVWYNFMEDFMIQSACPDAEVAELEALEPYRAASPWSKALQGKRVLVVHPFEDSIRLQYGRKDMLFENKDVLPDFTLMTYKAVQSNAGATTEYEDWFEALHKMYDDICRLDFEVAIIGCGAYGMPLASMVKDMGKKVVHLAGATQIMFGIRGARWDRRPEMQGYFNDYWIRPAETERPKDAGKVEGACYW